MANPNSTAFRSICALLFFLTLSYSAVALFDSRITHIDSISAVAGGCRGSMAECTAEGGDLDVEFLMDSETNRRLLASRGRYISYGALSRNNVPCSRRGASYYNCRNGGQANPYSRGCSTISRCRR